MKLGCLDLNRSVTFGNLLSLSETSVSSHINEDNSTYLQVYRKFLEKEMATHSSILAWKIPWTEAPGGLQSMGSQRVRHD